MPLPTSPGGQSGGPRCRSDQSCLLKEDRPAAQWYESSTPAAVSGVWGVSFCCLSFQPHALPRTGHPSSLEVCPRTSSRKLTPLHSLCPGCMTTPPGVWPWVRKQVTVSPFGYIPRHRRVTGRLRLEASLGQLAQLRQACGSRAQSPAASVDVVREQMLLLGHDQPA